jgi:hypothetical protein
MTVPILEAGVDTEPSLSRLVEKLKEQGFKCQLQVLPGGRVSCSECRREAHASALHIESYRRFEGQSDPDDMLFVAAVRWPKADAADCRGVLVLGFGPTASAEHKQVLAALQFDGSHDTPIA